MRTALQNALYETYPTLFRHRALPLTESGMGRGFECGDGWFGILDGLCAALAVRDKQVGHPSLAANQVKEEAGDLRFHINGECKWCWGAIEFASAISRFVCAETGRPGVLMVKRRWLRTLAEDVGHTNGYQLAATDEYFPIQRSPISVEDVLPPGWGSIASAMRSIIPNEGLTVSFRFSRFDNSLVVETHDKSERLSGAIFCAIQVAARMGPDSGVMVIPMLDGTGGDRGDG